MSIFVAQKKITHTISSGFKIIRMKSKDLKNSEELEKNAVAPEEGQAIELAENDKQVKDKAPEKAKKTTKKKPAAKQTPDAEDETKAEEQAKAETESKSKITAFFDAVEEKANAVKEKLEEKAVEIDGKIAESAAKLSVMADEVSGKITEIAQPAIDKIEELLDEENIEKGKAKLGEIADKVSDKITEIAQPAVDKIEELLDEENIEKGKDRLGKIADKVSDKITEIAQPAVDKIEELLDEENIEKGKARLGEIADKVSDKISEVAQPAVDKMEELWNEAKNAPIFNKKAEKVNIEEEIENQQQIDISEDFVDLTEKIDYSGYSQVELVNALREVVESAEENEIRGDIEAIKAVFYKHRNEQIEKDRAAFVEAGGNPEEFVALEDPYENDIKELLKRFNQVRKEHNRQLDSEKEENLARKLEIIEKIKGLINNEESINKTFNEFRQLQHEWRELGPVPQAKMKNLWDTYHFHVENFYDYIKINRELRDLDLKRNLETKLKICEAAEELLVEPNIIKAFNTLQKFHEQWREIGPVPRENKDDVWERFKLVTSKINKKHQDFFESKKTDQKKNYDAKIALCEKVEEICESEITSYKDWDAKSQELVELQKIWRTVGFAPKKDNNKIYDRFRNACDNFFNKKRDFYSKNKESQQTNLQLKVDLCVQAEALRENTDWKKATQDFINIQKKWKEIGPIPRKHSDAVWKRFRAACDFFFDKKSEHFSDIDTEQVDNLRMKEEIIAELENFKPSPDAEENLKRLREIQRRWTEIGHVPFKKKDAVQNKFREEISRLFDQLSINEEKRNLMRFKSKMTNFSESSRGQNKMRMEREKYMIKLKQLENDLVLLDNNIGFFAKSKNAEVLIEDVKRKIEDTRQKIESLKEKIRVIDEMED
jgi:coenzyme F420-reducing hydrogenase delta subunit